MEVGVLFSKMEPYFQGSEKSALDLELRDSESGDRTHKVSPKRLIFKASRNTFAGMKSRSPCPLP